MPIVQDIIIRKTESIRKGEKSLQQIKVLRDATDPILVKPNLHPSALSQMTEAKCF